MGNVADKGAGLALWTKSNAIVLDNIFWGNDAATTGNAIYLDATYGNTHLVFDYNDIYSLSSPYIFADAGCTIDYKSNSNILAIPDFVDRPNDNLHLLSSSACINAGMPDTTGWGIPDQDCDLQPRIINSIIDIGADEFYGSVTDLQIYVDSSDNAILTWSPVPETVTYKIYSSTDPYTIFPTGWTVEASGIPDTTWFDSVYPPITKKFYIVTAEN